jgi:hypothetical protein
VHPLKLTVLLVKGAQADVLEKPWQPALVVAVLVPVKVMLPEVLTIPFVVAIKMPTPAPVPEAAPVRAIEPLPVAVEIIPVERLIP